MDAAFTAIRAKLGPVTVLVNAAVFSVTAPYICSNRAHRWETHR